MLNKTILVVEDEPDLLDLIQELLMMDGYTVLNAASGASALEVWKKNSHEINLLLTDLTLPAGLTGAALASKLCKEKPSLKVIFTSGHTAEMVAQKYPLPPRANFLQKPFDPALLAQTVRDSFNS